MSDENKLLEAQSRADRAQSLLNDEILTEAFKGLEDAYTLAWRSTLVDEAGAREKLFLAINIVGKVRNHLIAIITDGKLAAAEMRQLVETAERKTKWENLRV